MVKLTAGLTRRQANRTKKRQADQLSGQLIRFKTVRLKGRAPNRGSVRHYLEAVARAGTDDTETVMKAMRAAPIHDVFTDNGVIRADGRVLYDRYLMRVKSPAESKYPWDYLTVVAKVPATEAFRPPGAGGCTLAAP